MLYICENNRYAMGTSVERASAGGGDFHKKFTWAQGMMFDAHDIFEVREAVKYAKNFALENGPVFLNAKTYRYHGHSMSDPGSTYRLREEVSDIRKTKDPLLLMKNHILENDVASEKELKKIDKEIKEQLTEEAERAFNGKEYDLSELQKDVYSNDMQHYMRAPNFEDSLFIKEKYVQ